MARRKSTVRYNIGTKAKPKIEASTIWVQALNPEQARSSDILLQLYRDEDNNAVITTDKDGNPQYQCSIPMQGEAYAYVPTKAMKALIATGRVRELDGNHWVHITFDNLVPDHKEFARATSVKEV